jgi:hypothetical protein
MNADAHPGRHPLLQWWQRLLRLAPRTAGAPDAARIYFAPF